MKVLIACEESQTVRKAFRAKGHEAYSNDIIPCSGGHPEWHLQMDALEAIKLMDWDMMIAHPPCTYLTVTGNKWMKPEFKDRFPNREQQRNDAIDLFMKFVNSNISKIAIENPIGIMSTIYRKPDQVIQPFFFGNEARKATCLWLKRLPKLKHIKENDLFDEKTHVEQGEIITYKSGKTCAKWYADAVKLSQSERSTARSVTFPGIAAAMAEQWG